MVVIKEIKDNFTRAGHPIAFSSPGNIATFYKRQGVHYKKRDIDDTLQTIDSYVLQRKYHRPRVRNPWFVYLPKQEYQMDLIDAVQLKRYNGGISFILVLIDSATKKVWVRGLKKKSAEETSSAIRSIIDPMGAATPREIISDFGTEFENVKVKNYLKSKNIRLRHPKRLENKPSFVERVNGTIQGLLYAEMQRAQSYRYIDYLDSLIDGYNSRVHSTIKMTPNEAELPENKELLLNVHNARIQKIVAKRKEPKYSIGTIVLLKLPSTKFQRGYQQQFGGDKFEIVGVNERMPIPMYFVKKLSNGELMEGGYYEGQLQPVVNDGAHSIKALPRKIVRRAI